MTEPLATPASTPLAPGLIAVVGAGALGSLVAGRLARSNHAGLAVHLIGREAAVQAIQQAGLQLQEASGEIHTVHLPVTTDMAALRQARVVLLGVKSADTEAAALQMAPWLHPQALVLSLQNGVGNAEVLTRVLQRPVGVALAYVAAALPAPGHVQHAGGQDIVMGLVATEAAVTADSIASASPSSPDFQRELAWAQAALTAAGFTVRLSAQPLAALWSKLVVNCACNAISGLAQANYSAMAALPAVRDLQRAVVQEAVAVAQAEGHALVLADLLAAVDRVALNMPQQRSSTAQDLARGRRSEIDFLNGEVVRRGAVHGIATPANQALWALVKLLESQQG